MILSDQMETVCNSVDQLLQYNQRASIKIGGLTSPINTGQLCVIILTTDPKFHMQVDVNILRCTDPSVVVKIQYSGGLRVSYYPRTTRCGLDI